MSSKAGGNHRQPHSGAAAHAEETGQLVLENVQRIASMEEAERKARGAVDRVVDRISSFCGSLLFVYIHLVWFALWLGINLSPIRDLRFDPYPFGLLTLVVSLEAILLSTFILITQNRQARMADRRHHLDLQINMLAEQEATKMLVMLERIEKRLGIREQDPEVAALEQATEPDKVVAAIKEYVEEGEASPS
jgi:uncharacterized membrane protein